jgi:hypothetical protein
MMAVVNYAFFGSAFLGTFILTQLVTSRLLGDPTNIEFNKSMVLAFVAGLVFQSGTPFVGDLLSPDGAIVFGISALVLWSLTEFLYDCDRWIALWIAMATSAFFAVLFHGIAWIWGRVTGAGG